MGRSKFPGKPSRLASKKRVSVLVATCLSSSSSSSSVSNSSSSIAVSPSRGKSSPLSNGYNEDTTISSSSGDLIKKCSGSSVDEAAPAGSVVQTSNSNSDSISNNHSNHVATSVIKVQSPCNNSNTTSTSDRQDEEEGGCGGVVAATGGEIIAIVSSHNIHDGDKTQVRQPYLYLSIHSNNCGGDDDK